MFQAQTLNGIGMRVLGQFINLTTCITVCLEFIGI